MEPSEVQMLRNLRQAYENAPRRKRKHLPYDIVLAMFRDPANRYEDIGRRLNINHQTTCKLYFRYFEPVVRMSGLDRWRQRNDELLRQRVRGFDDCPLLKFVAKKAYQAGLDVRRYQQPTDRWKLHESALYIEEQLCLVYRTTRAHKTGSGRQRYASALVVRPGFMRYDARVIRIDIPGHRKGTLVIPAHVLRRIPGDSRKVHIWIPLKKSSSQPARSRINWWQYDNAWHLLESE